MLACVHAATLLGIEACPVAVEVDLSPGLPGFATVGLAQGAVKESRERVTAAARSGRLQVLLESQVRRIGPASVVLDVQGRELELANDAVIVSAPPFPGSVPTSQPAALRSSRRTLSAGSPTASAA